VTELLQASASLNSSPAEMKPAIAALLTESPAVAAGEATLSGRFDGTWEASTSRCLAAPSPALPCMLVPRTPNSCFAWSAINVQSSLGPWQVFHAPHLASLGAALGARFEPIRYRLAGDRLVSNVRFSSSLARVRALSQHLSQQQWCLLCFTPR